MDDLFSYQKGRSDDCGRDGDNNSDGASNRDDGSGNSDGYSQSHASVFNVTELSNALRMTVEESFSYVSVEGEVSSLRVPYSGHCYFKLKDEKNLINSIIWKGTATKMPFKLEEGMQIIAHGKITTYGARSEYQLVINRVEQAGLGALMQRFEELKLRLSEEGLFDEERKRPIPYLPNKIGIITSPTGAVIEDIKHRISDRFPRDILLYPTLVQGKGAKEQIVAGIEYFNRLAEVDILIIARGGGSLEDLWAFNEEVVVRAIANSKIPVVSAVGHEVDFTLCDFVADLRAPTPTAAAEMVVPVREDLLYNLQQQELRIKQALSNFLSNRKQRVELLAKSLPDLSSLLTQARLRSDDRQERLVNAMQNYLVKHKMKLSEQSKLLKSLSPQGVLGRGYSYSTDEQGKLITSVSQLRINKEATLHYHDGEQKVVVK